ncbi:MAG: type II toxin-antitoxin system HicB family antitoxin [Armatimonadetes bacterium]|nr:type II toxin-antitoxin system HicB family antitoxin [Armatimonadota bacterium]
MATVPGLRGAVTQGRTVAEARRNILEVIETLLDLYREQTPPDAIRATVAVEVTA